MSATGLPRGPRVPADFGFTDEHAMLGASARRFLTKGWDAPQLRRFVEGRIRGGAPVDLRPLATQMKDLGWFDMITPPEDGGGGLGWLHAALLAEELGRVLCPIRWASRTLAGHAVQRTGGDGTIVFDADEATLVGDDLTGRHRLVPEGVEARFLVAPVRREDETLWVEIDLTAKQVCRTAREVQDPTRPRADLAYESVRAYRVIDLPDDRSPERLTFGAWLFHAAESLGAAETVLELTRDYATERQQFGRPIGSFQAVSHPIVDTMIAIERARNLTCALAAALDAGGAPTEIEPLARMAKSAADDALFDGAARAVQLHGGFGFTWDCDVHFYLRRAMSARSELGSPSDHRRVLAERLLGT